MTNEDLISYFDKRFDESERRTRQIVEETSRQIEALRGETSRQIGETSRQIEALRGETSRQIGETSRQIEALRGEIDGLREDTSRQFDALSEKVDTEIRHTRVLIEDLRSDVKAVAEGVVNVDGKLDRHIERIERQIREDQAANRLVFVHHRDRLDGHETRISGIESARG